MEETLKALVGLTGPCGFEHDVARYILDKMKDVADEAWVDGLGNVIVRKRGKHPGPKLVVSVHMDEVGFIVKKIEQNGLIRFEKLGGHDDRILLAQKVKIASERGVHLGVIGTISAHMVRFDDANRVRKHSELYIDVGAQSRAEVEEMGIQIGDPIGWATAYEHLTQRRVVGKGFDDRAGCAVLVEAILGLNFDHVHGEVYGVFSVQEEVGLRGAKAAGDQIPADVALAVDTTAVSDTPEAMMDQTLAIGQGPCVKVMDASLIASVAVRRKLVQVAKEAGIPYQLEVFTGIGTDAGELHKTQGGVPTGVVSIPSRYAHSPVEVIDLQDLEDSKKLLQAFILNMRTPEEFRLVR